MRLAMSVEFTVFVQVLTPSLRKPCQVLSSLVCKIGAPKVCATQMGVGCCGRDWGVTGVCGGWRAPTLCVQGRLPRWRAMPAVYLFSSHVRGEVVLDRIRYYIQTLQRKRDAMPSATNIKSISYLKSHAAQISEDLAANGAPFFITQNGEASMVIESVTRFQEKEALIAALKVMALGEKDRLQGKGLTVAESRAQLAAARQQRK